MTPATPAYDARLELADELNALCDSLGTNTAGTATYCAAGGMVIRALDADAFQGSEWAALRATIAVVRDSLTNNRYRTERVWWRTAEWIRSGTHPRFAPPEWIEGELGNEYGYSFIPQARAFAGLLRMIAGISATTEVVQSSDESRSSSLEKLPPSRSAAYFAWKWLEKNHPEKAEEGPERAFPFIRENAPEYVAPEGSKAGQTFARYVREGKMVAEGAHSPKASARDARSVLTPDQAG